MYVQLRVVCTGMYNASARYRLRPPWYRPLPPPSPSLACRFFKAFISDSISLLRIDCRANSASAVSTSARTMSIVSNGGRSWAGSRRRARSQFCDFFKNSVATIQPRNTKRLITTTTTPFNDTTKGTRQQSYS